MSSLRIAAATSRSATSVISSLSFWLRHLASTAVHDQRERSIKVVAVCQTGGMIGWVPRDAHP
jgi:hypothetical protein